MFLTNIHALFCCNEEYILKMKYFIYNIPFLLRELQAEYFLRENILTIADRHASIRHNIDHIAKLVNNSASDNLNKFELTSFSVHSGKKHTAWLASGIPVTTSTRIG